MADVRRLRTRDERDRAEQVAELRQALLPFEDGCAGEMGRRLLWEVDRAQVASEWSFVMLSPSQNAAVVDWLSRHSQRPLVALRVWAQMIANLDRDSGEVMLTRAELAALVGERANNLSAVVSEMGQIGAVSRRRDGARVRYYVSPLIATHLPLVARQRAQKAAMRLSVVAGAGKRLVPP